MNLNSIGDRDLKILNICSDNVMFNTQFSVLREVGGEKKEGCK